MAKAPKVECFEVLRLLSEYADDELDSVTRGRVAEHLAGCEACEAELRALETLMTRIGAAERINAPPEFLENVHVRLGQRSSARRIVGRIFYPLHVKVPLEVAGVVAALLLIVTLHHGMRPFSKHADSPGISQKPPSEMRELSPPLRTPSAPAPLPKRAESAGEESGGRKMALLTKTPSDHSVDRTKPIEIVLLVRQSEQAYQTTESETEKTSSAAVRSVAPAGSHVRERVGLPSQPKAPTSGTGTEPSRSDRSVSRARKTPALPAYDRASTVSLVRSCIEGAGGTVLAVKGIEHKDEPISLSVKVPAEKLSLLLESLRSVGELSGPPLSFDAKSRESWSVKIELRSAQ